MAWKKLGLVYSPIGKHGWDCTHASVPTVDIISDNLWRVYFATRDKTNRCRISYIEVAAGNPTELIYVHDKAVLELGEPGSFDNAGIMPSWITETADARKYLYYIGWTVRKDVPYHNSIGLAVSEDGGETYRKYAKGPIFGLTPEEPFFNGTSCVLLDNGVWKNWYMSCVGWESVKNRQEPRYHIKYAESADGIDWKRKGTVAIDFKNQQEAGIVRASVIKSFGTYQMYYSYRNGVDYREDPNQSYRIGFAESLDGIHWERKDEQAGIERSESGWDSMMIEYPYVIEWKGQKYMFYNGNTFGLTGVGAAIWE